MASRIVSYTLTTSFGINVSAAAAETAAIKMRSHRCTGHEVATFRRPLR